jgi:hypothetical protein
MNIGFALRAATERYGSDIQPIDPARGWAAGLSRCGRIAILWVMVPGVGKRSVMVDEQSETLVGVGGVRRPFATERGMM